MSTDARYLLCYENLPYVKPTPMETDIDYLSHKYGGSFNVIGCVNVFWEKPKYTLHPEEFDKLLADQVLERRDCELWSIVK